MVLHLSFGIDKAFDVHCMISNLVHFFVYDRKFFRFELINTQKGKKWSSIVRFSCIGIDRSKRKGENDRAHPRFEARAPVSSWIFKIACNLSIIEAKRLLLLMSLAQGATCREKVVAREASSDSNASSELEDEIMSALDQLPENQRAALLLRVNEGLPYREIADVLQLSVQSVESLIFRARRHLKQSLRKIAKK